jgi:hypothetical protein
MEKQYFIEVFEQNASKFYDWRYGEEVSPELQEIFEYIEENHKDEKFFDWKEEEEAMAYKAQMQDQGYAVIDAGVGSDAYDFIVI